MGLPIKVNIDADKTIAEFRKLEKETFGGVLSNTLGIAGDAIGFFRGKVSLWYANNINETFIRYKKLAAQAGYEFPYNSDNVPPYVQTFLIKALEAAATETNDELRELWAKFLVGSLKNESTDASGYVELIKSLGTYDVILLDDLFKNSNNEHEQFMMSGGFTRSEFPIDKFKNSDEDTCVSMAKLQNLSLAEFYFLDKHMKETDSDPIANEIQFKGVKLPSFSKVSTSRLYYRVLPLGIKLRTLLNYD